MILKEYLDRVLTRKRMERKELLRAEQYIEAAEKTIEINTIEDLIISLHTHSLLYKDME